MPTESFTGTFYLSGYAIICLKFLTKGLILSSCRICSWFGILALIQSLVNRATIGPIVFFVGLMVNEEALNFIPSRHYSAYLIGLFPSIYDWVTNVSGLAPLGQEFNVNYTGSDGWIGVLAWKRGALLVSMLWVAMLVNVLDRQWKLATYWAITAFFFALFGIIHVPEAGFENFTTPTPEQCWNTAPPGEDPVVECWPFAIQWMFVVAYAMLAATFVIIHFVQKYDATIDDPIDDESRHAFDDWFKDAAVDTTYDGKVVDHSDPDPTTHLRKESGDDEVVVDSEESEEVVVDIVDGDNETKEIALERLDL